MIEAGYLQHATLDSPAALSNHTKNQNHDQSPGPGAGNQERRHAFLHLNYSVDTFTRHTHFNRIWIGQNLKARFEFDYENMMTADNWLELDRVVDRVKPWFMVNGLAHGS